MEIIKLNLIPTGITPSCHCSQYDNGRTIRVDLFNGFTPYVLQSGDTVTLNVRKPDNTIVVTSLTATQGNTYVNIETTEQMCACVGFNLCDLTIENGSKKIGTLNFIMQIERDVLADGIPSQSRIDDLEELVREAVGDDYYTKSETNNLLDGKADSDEVYTKAQVDGALALKADSDNVYSKQQIDSSFDAVNTEINNLAVNNDLIGANDRKTVTPTFTNGKFINPTTGATSNNADAAYSDYINVKGFERVKLSTIVNTSNVNRGLAFYDENKTYISGIKALFNSTISSVYSVVRDLPIPVNAVFMRTTWIASTVSGYNDFTFECVLKKGKLLVENNNISRSANVFDFSKLTVNKYIQLNGEIKNSTIYSVTDFIPVKQGDIIVGGRDRDYEPREMAYVTAYDVYGEVVSGSGATNVTSYTVPSGVGFVRISANSQWINLSRSKIFLNGTLEKTQPFYEGMTKDLASDNYTNISNLLRYPVTSLPSYIQDNLAYKPLGSLSKGYVCLVADDGRAELETYTIPLIINKEVPATWAVMQESEVFQSQTGLAAVIDSVNNHGCDIAQHGNINWDNYDEYSLNCFFDEQKVYFDSIGLIPYGAVCPSHHINNMIRAVAGGRFGCLRTGFQYGTPYYDNYTNGARSNLYGLTCYGVTDGTLQGQKDKLDYVKANNLLCIIFWHDNDMSDPTTLQRLSDVIDYAKSINIDFITMKDIPNII